MVLPTLTPSYHFLSIVGEIMADTSILLMLNTLSMCSNMCKSSTKPWFPMVSEWCLILEERDSWLADHQYMFFVCGKNR